jgi:hypothetical protein
MKLLSVVFLLLSVTLLRSEEAPAYQAWPALRSELYPLVIYSEGKTAPAEVLFRAENRLRAFERSYPGFSFSGMRTIEIPLAWDASRRFAQGNRGELVVKPVDLSDDLIGKAEQRAIDSEVGSVLYSAVWARTGGRLPVWLLNLVTTEFMADQIVTGATPQILVNPAIVSRETEGAAFTDLASMEAGIPWDANKVWYSGMMYLRFARESPDGAKLRQAFADVLAAASSENAAPEAIQEKVGALHGVGKELEPALKQYWTGLSSRKYLLENYLEGIARLWSALAMHADRAGTRYSSFADLRAAVEEKRLTLPPGIPSTLAGNARTFLDRDGAYTLSWEGASAKLKLVSREGWGLEVTARMNQGLVHDEAKRFVPGAGELAQLPSVDASAFYSDHYLLLSDCEPSVASDLLLQADRFHDFLTGELPWDQPAEQGRMVMLYFSDAWGSGLNRRNFFDPSTGTTFVSPLGDDVMRHESVHQVVEFSCKGKFAWWFNEAMAVYFGNQVVFAGDKFLAPAPQPNYIWGLQEYLAGNVSGKWGNLTLAELVNLDPAGWVSHGPSVYPLAWSVVHFLQHGDGGAHRAILQDYLKAVASDETTEKERNAKFHAAVLALEPQWRAYWTSASSLMHEPMQREAMVRVMFQVREEAIRQFPEEAGKPLIPNEVILKLAPASSRRNRVMGQSIEELIRMALWRNEWSLTGEGGSEQLRCGFSDGSAVTVWRDPRTQALQSTMTISPEHAAMLAKSTMPAHVPPQPEDDNIYKPYPATKPEKAQKPWPAIGVDGLGLAPSEASPASGPPAVEAPKNPGTPVPAPFPG